MKVVCIDNDNLIHGTGISLLTIDKIYDVIEERGVTLGSIYRLKDDRGEITWYSVSRFVSLQEVRNEKIDQILL